MAVIPQPPPYGWPSMFRAPWPAYEPFYLEPDVALVGVPNPQPYDWPDVFDYPWPAYGEASPFDDIDYPLLFEGGGGRGTLPLPSGGTPAHQYTTQILAPSPGDAIPTTISPPSPAWITLPFGPNTPQNVMLTAIVNLEILESDLTANRLYFELDVSVDGGSTWTTLQSLDWTTVANALSSISFGVVTELAVGDNNIILQIKARSPDGNQYIMQSGGDIGTSTNSLWAQCVTID